MHHYQDEFGSLKASGNGMAVHLVATHSYYPGKLASDLFTAKQVYSFLEVLANAFPVSSMHLRQQNRVEIADIVVQLADDFEKAGMLDYSFNDYKTPIMLDVKADDLTIAMTEYAVSLLAQDSVFNLRGLLGELYFQGWEFEYDQEAGLFRPRVELGVPEVVH